MEINGRSSGQTMITAVRQEMQSQLAAAKKTLKDTGHVSGVSQNFTSGDGNVSIRLSGRTLDDGREALFMDYRVDGAEGAAMGKALSGGIDNFTGQAYAADTQFGGPAGSGSAVIADPADIDALGDAMHIDTQAENNAKIQHWGLSDGTYTDSLAEYQASNRADMAIKDVVDKIAGKMTFSSPEAEVEFSVNLNKALMAFTHKGDDSALSELLKGAGGDALSKAIGTLSGGGEATSKLVSTLQDYLHRQAPGAGKAGLLNLVV